MPIYKSSDGVRLVYENLGPVEGQPVVLCHGLGAAGEQMMEDARFFAGEGYRVLVPDLRGHGRSDRPAKLAAETLSIARLAADALELLDHAGAPRVHWVGNSLGGILALALLPANENRFRTLATFGTAYRLDLPAPLATATISAGYALLGPRLTGELTALMTTRNRKARPLIARLIRNLDPQVASTLAGNLARYDLRANASAARLPILLMRGGRDRSINAALRGTLPALEGRPNFTLAELPEGGHCANLDATEAWRSALLEFWRRNESGASARPRA